MNAEDFLVGVGSGLLVTILGLIVLYFTNSHRDTLGFQQTLFLTAIAIRLVAAAAVHEPTVYETIVGSADASGWDAGRIFMHSIDDSGLGPLAIPAEVLKAYEGKNRGYGTVVGLYFCFSRLDTQLSAAALSCLAGSMTAVIAYRLARLIFSESVAMNTGWLICFFPSMIIWSIQSIKEPFVILCEVVAMYACIHLKSRGFSSSHILLWLFSILVVVTLRFYAAYMLGGVILVALLAPNLGRGSVPFGSAVTGGIILFSALSMASDTVQAHREAFETYDMDKVQEFRVAVTRGEGSGSGVESSFDLKSSGGRGMATLVGALHLLLAPFPWQFGGGSTRFLLTFPEMLVWWYLVARGLFRGLARCLRRQPGDVLPMLMFMIVLGSVYSLMFGNIGIIYRQRSQLLPYLFMIIMVGFEGSRAKRIQSSQTEEHFESVATLARTSSGLESPP